jgi:hypothetical protein
MSVAVFETNTKPAHKPLAAGPRIAAAIAANGRHTPPPPRHAVPPPDAARALVISVIWRIEGYLDEETAALQKLHAFDFKASNDRKSQGLVDLNQALRRLQKPDVNPELVARLEAFRSKLAANQRVIRLHLDAVKEIAALLSDAIQNAASDGTYTRSINPYRSAP